MQEPTLVLFDTDRIKEYVFATARLKEIRNASAILDDLNREQTKPAIKKVAPDADMVFANGGAAMAIVPAGKEQEVIHAVEHLYAKKTVNASISGVSAPLTPEAFGLQVKRLSARLRQHKQEKAALVGASTAPWVEFCRACGIYPASGYDATDGMRVCRACYIKRKTTLLGPWGRFAAHIGPSCGKIDEMIPETLGQVGQASWPQGYIGFIYCDGNRFGKAFSGIDAKEDYRIFAERLDRLLCEVTFDVLSRMAPPRKIQDGNIIYPFDILMLGGDDIMLITPADRALPIALDICQDFAERAGEELKRNLSLSAAVVLAHAKFPILSLNQLAGELLKLAKRESALPGKAEMGMIDFAAVTDSTSDSVQRVREEYLSYQDVHGKEITLTDRPYTLDGLRDLLDSIARIKGKGVPRNRLQFMYEGLFKSEEGAAFNTAMVLGRLKEEYREPLLDLFSGAAGCQPRLPPWVDRSSVAEPDKISTPLLDLVELYRFVPAAEERA